MKILLTGVSSFTGSWFARELAAEGHEVHATLQGAPIDYEGVRAQRVRAAGEACQLVSGCSFGSDSFLELVHSSSWDALCHHAADVTNYRSPDFDVVEALRNNSLRAPEVLDGLAEAGCRRILLTGSIFECDEGVGSDGCPAFSPYGLSKALTYQVFRLHALDRDLHLGKFVIPNPFGAFEEPRFTAYLMRTWHKGEVAGVNTPAYVRDNIHVSLLAKSYRQFLESLPDTAGLSRLNPSGYVESQGAFATRFAREMASRLDMECALDLAHQTEFPEPRIRVNTDPMDEAALGWNEAEAWDGIADFYRDVLGE